MTVTQYAVIEWSPGKVRAFDPLSRQLVTEKTVADALRRIGNPSSVGLCLSRRTAFVRETRLPDVEKSQARTILGLRIDEMFPSVEDGVSFDFVIGQHRYEDGLLTTVMAASTALLNRAIDEVKNAGASIAWTAPVAFGSIEAGRSMSPQPYAVVESDGEFLSIDVVRHSSLIYSRSVIDPLDPQARSAEVARTLAACGVTDAVPLTVAGTELSVSTQSALVEPLVAMANHSPAEINILTPDAVERAAKASSGAKNRLALLLWLAVVCVGGLVWNDRMDTADVANALISKDQKKRSRALDNAKVVKKAIDAEKQKFDRVMLAFQPAQHPGELFSVLSHALPSGAWLTGVNFERGKPVQVRGTAIRGESVSEFTTALALDTRFRDVKLVFANNALIEATPVIQFSVTAHVVGNLPLEDKDIVRSTE